RRRPGTYSGPASARQATGTASRGAHDHEPAARVQHVAAELRGKSIRVEHALEDGPRRPVLERPVLPALPRLVVSSRPAAEHNELRRDAARLREELHALLLDEVAVEVAREDALERAVRERQRKRVALHELAVGESVACLVEHGCALVEPDHL